MINLRITEEQFDELYPDLAGQYAHFDNPPPPGIASQAFERNYLSSKLWRLNNIYSVVDKHGQAVIFRMNYAQHRVYAASRRHPRIIILKSRQQGISTFWLVSYCDDAIFCPRLNVGLMAQGTDEATTLLERVEFLIDALSEDVKNFIGFRVIKNNTKELGFENKSTIFIRVSFRSTTLQRLHVSEMGKIANNYPARAKEVKTGTLQALAAGETGVIESTAEGHNDFKDMWDAAILAESYEALTKKDFLPVFLSWLDDPDCNEAVDQAYDNDAVVYFTKLEQITGRKLTKNQKNFWVSQRRELGADIFQEYPATPEEAFAAARDGTYYSKLFQAKVVAAKRVIPGLYDSQLGADAYFDLGVDDYTVVGVTQFYRTERRITHEYWNNGRSIGHYLQWLLDLGVDIRYVVLPHDANQRTTATKDEDLAKSTADIAREWIREKKLRWIVRVLERTNIESGIQATRLMLSDFYIDPSCTYLIDCLNKYTKEWDPKLKVWKKTPKHDEFSHGADMLRQVASDVRGNVDTDIPERYRRQRSTSGYAI